MTDELELIEKIEVSEAQVQRALEWLSKGKNNGLDYLTSDVIRYLIKKVAELELKVSELTPNRPERE